MRFAASFLVSRILATTLRMTLGRGSGSSTASLMPMLNSSKLRLSAPTIMAMASLAKRNRCLRLSPMALATEWVAWNLTLGRMLRGTSPSR